MSRVVGCMQVLLAVFATALFHACVARADSPPVAMVDPQWQPQTDSQGTSWMIDQQSNLRVNGGQTMLLSVGMLTVNSQQFMPQRVQMTPDGCEYVFEGIANNPYGAYGGGAAIQTTRRVKLDLPTSTVRFVESFQNSTATPVLVSVAANSTMRTFVRSVVCGPSGTSLDPSTGQPLAGPPAGVSPPYGRVIRTATVRLALPERDCGVAVSEIGGNFPAAFFYVPSSGTVKPAIDVQSMRTVRVSFNVTVPPQSTVSVVWGISQRNTAGMPGAQEMKDQLKTFQDRQWLAGLPDAVTKTIVNFRPYSVSGGLAMGPLLQPVLELAARYNVERGKSDVLVQDEQLRLTGVVSGGSISVATSFGKVALPLADVALLCGGGGIDRQMRVFLRNGEILLGRVEAKDLLLKAPGGVEAKLPPEKVNLLFLHAGADDGKAPAEAAAVLQMHDGQRLLLTGSDARFHAASPWGGADIGLGEIVSLASRREPQPLYRLALRDGSNLSVLLQGDLPAVNTLRFGQVKLMSVGLRQLWSLKTRPAKKAADDEPSDGISAPHCQLIGDNVLVGTIDTPRLLLATPGGVLGLSVSGIQTAQRSGDAKAGGPFNVELTNGRRLTGTLSNRTIAVRFHGRVWEIPGQHLVSVTGRSNAEENTSEPRAGASKPSGEEEEPSRTPAPADTDSFGAPPSIGPAPPTTTPVVPPPAPNDDPFG